MIAIKWVSVVPARRSSRPSNDAAIQAFSRAGARIVNKPPTQTTTLCKILRRRN